MSDITISNTEADELARCEDVITEGMATFLAVGEALLTIRDRRLYRATHGTFEEYARQRWGLSRPRAYELMGASQTVTALSAIADTARVTNEGQARELVKIARAEGVDRAAEVLGALTGDLTARAIREQAARTLAHSRLTAALALHGIHTIDPALAVIPEHNDHDRDLLALSIEAYGWDDAIGRPRAIAEDDGSLTLIDGRARLLIGADLDQPAPIHIISADEVRDRFALTYGLNVTRRHLTQDQSTMFTGMILHAIEKADPDGTLDDIDMGADFAVMSYKWSADVCRRHLTPDEVRALRLVKQSWRGAA